MREIKFRAWVDDSMWTVNGLACSDDSDEMDLIDHSIGGYTKVSDFDYTKDCVLMQYSGIKDINGKEIYEGDIIYHHHSEEEYQLQGVVQYEVKWGGFFFAGNRGMNTKTRYEILGNIYENPELIEGETKQ